MKIWDVIKSVNVSCSLWEVGPDLRPFEIPEMCKRSPVRAQISHRSVDTPPRENSLYTFDSINLSRSHNVPDDSWWNSDHQSWFFDSRISLRDSACNSQNPGLFRINRLTRRRFRNTPGVPLTPAFLAKATSIVVTIADAFPDLFAIAGNPLERTQLRDTGSVSGNKKQEFPLRARM